MHKITHLPGVKVKVALNELETETGDAAQLFGVSVNELTEALNEMHLTGEEKLHD